MRGTDSVEYAYNALGELVRGKTEGVVDRHFLWDNGSWSGRPVLGVGGVFWISLSYAKREIKIGGTTYFKEYRGKAFYTSLLGYVDNSTIRKSFPVTAIVDCGAHKGVVAGFHPEWAGGRVW